jgi:hypothetical protein
MAPAAALPPMTPSKTSSDTVDTGKYGELYEYGEPKKSLIATGLYRLPAQDEMEVYQATKRMELVGNYLEML